MKVLLFLIISISSFPLCVNLLDVKNQTVHHLIPQKKEKQLTQEKDSVTIALDLSNQNLEFIPNELLNYVALETINLSQNQQLKIEQSFYRLAQIKTLRAMNLSSCQLAYIPFSINEIRGLEVLDLSNNYLFEIPDMMHKMQHLKHVDLSQNDLKELGYAPSLWRNLETINLKGNPRLDMENAFRGLSYLTQLKRVEVSNLREIPENTIRLDVEELVFEACSFKESTVKFPENSKIKAVVFDDCKKTKFNKVLPAIATNKKLEELKLINNNLKRLVIDSIQFPNLKLLDLSGNAIDPKDLERLKKQFPNCKIEDGREENKSVIPEKRIISPPIQQALITPKEFEVVPNQPQRLTTSNSRLTIPQNAFLDEAGKVITTPVKIAYKEILNPVDQILSGIPMEYDSAGTTYNFESAGMIEFRAESEGKEVFPNPNALINVELDSKFTDANYSFYSIDDETGKWDYLQPAIQKEEVTNATAPKLNKEISALKPELTLPQLRHHIVKNRRGRKTYYVKVYQNYIAGGYYESLQFLNKSKLIVDYKKARVLRRTLKKYHKENRNYLGVHDGELVQENLCFGYDFTINKEQDVFDLTIHYIDSSLTVPCRLSSKSNKNSEQKQYLKFWKRYNKIMKEERGEQATKLKKYTSEMNTYESRLQVYQDEMRNYRGALTYTKTYTVGLTGFGIFNWDRLPRASINITQKKKRNRVKVMLKNVGKALFVPVVLYILDKKNNTYIKERDVNHLTYDEGRKYSLLLMDAEENIVIVNHKAFADGVKNMQDFTVEFEPEFIAKDDVKRADLLKKLM
ncbi:MAG: leucine-rich repeat domain-containing protein [Flavobacteriales bacterium]|jgi:hypothetical protein|nr:leucine-rich repeat domain-containing protein [Flavobacteriales bacterium]